MGCVSCRILPGVWPMPVQVLSTQRTALAPQAPPGVEKQIRTGGGGGGRRWGGVLTRRNAQGESEVFAPAYLPSVIGKKVVMSPVSEF